MCGIAGFTGKKNETQLKAMNRELVHRGPDDEGYYFGEGINMGMRRLSIIDLKTGHQPLHNEDQSVWATCNGEIYNFQAIRVRLQEQGHHFYTASDCEVLVHLYEEDGDEFLRSLNGMFAFALWDGNRRRLILARDRLGVKPLYYYFDGSQIYYASEIKSLLKIEGFQKRLSYEGLSHYLTYRNVPAPMSIYEGVASLLPGEYLVFEMGKIVKKKYWEVDFSRQEDLTEEAAEEKILSVLKDAVRLRMISDVPVGAYLSGGVDSSLVVALMSEMSAGKKIKTFSLGFEEKLANKNDSFYARRIAEQYGTEHYEYVMRVEELPASMPDIAWHLDQPFSGVISTFFLSKLVQQHVKVALTGDGADDQFGSYAHHRLCWPIENYLRARRSNLPESSVDFRPYQGKEDYVKDLAEDDLADWRIKFYAFTEEDKRRLLAPEIYEQVSSFNSLNLLRRHLDRSPELDSLNRLLEHDIHTLLPDEILVFADRLSMAHSIELRSPFLDYRFVEMAAAIPGSLKIKDGVSKYILKKVAARYLPAEVLDRPKEGFILPQDAWMLGKLQGYVRDLLSEERLKLHGLFNAREVSKFVEDYMEQKHPWTYKMWTLVMFQVWYEHCFLK